MEDVRLNNTAEQTPYIFNEAYTIVYYKRCHKAIQADNLAGAELKAQKFINSLNSKDEDMEPATSMLHSIVEEVASE